MTVRPRDLSAISIDTPFDVSRNGEPHRIRRGELIRKYPQIRQLFGYDRRTIWITLAVVVAQFGIAGFLHQASEAGSWLGSWWMIIAVAYLVGSILSHWTGQTIHETSHNLAAKNAMSNRALAFFANLPMLFPIAATFRRYHIAHHTYLGVDGKDTDLPLEFEVKLLENSRIKKFVWLFFYFFVYVFRGMTFAKFPNRAEWLNLAVQVVVSGLVWYFLGWPGVAYLALSTIFGHSLHPVAGHFLHEHYVFRNGQETNSYYGILNKVTFNVGYHVEHHDFMNIPGSKLPQLHAMAPEFYQHLKSHNSWGYVLWKFIVDKSLSAANRIVRKDKRPKKHLEPVTEQGFDESLLTCV